MKELTLQEASTKTGLSAGQLGKLAKAGKIRHKWALPGDPRFARRPGILLDAASVDHFIRHELVPGGVR